MGKKQQFPTIHAEDVTRVLLPPSLLLYIANFLDVLTLSYYARACHGTYGLFAKQIEIHKTKHLLQQVILGKPKEVQSFLQKYRKVAVPECLITLRSAIGEPCQRHWHAISPLEYAAWSGDIEIVDILLSELLDNEINLAIQQLEAIKNHTAEHGAIFAPIKAFIAAAENYNYNYHRWNNTYRKDYWVNEIGGKQVKLPINILQWYCSSVRFYPLPDFRAPLERTLTYCLNNEKKELLPLHLSGLGVKIAISKGYWSELRIWEIPFESIQDDCKALKHFCQIRFEDLAQRIQFLKKKLLRIII